MSGIFRGDGPTIIGMVHIRALPGTPRHAGSLTEILQIALDEARVLADCGVDGLIIENMHDVPYLKGGVGPEIVAAMTAAGLVVRTAGASILIGVQILAGANQEALAVAHASGAQFIRAENFVFAHVADEGLMPTAAAGALLRYRRQIGADNIRIWADIKKKHASHALTADISVADMAAAAEFNGADAVIITGRATGSAAEIEDMRTARAAVKIPVLVGSGVTRENLESIWPLVNGVIVGSAFKIDGFWANEVDPRRVTQFMEHARQLRGRP